MKIQIFVLFILSLLYSLSFSKKSHDKDKIKDDNIKTKELMSKNINDKNDNDFGTVTKNTAVKYLIYVVYHDALSKAIAEEFSKNHEWSKPLGIRSTVFFEAISFRDGISFNYEQWKDMDYVGLISYKAANDHQILSKISHQHHNYNISFIPDLVAKAFKEDYDIVPFFRSPNFDLMLHATTSHKPQFQVAWDNLLVSIGFNLENIRSQDKIKPFYKSAFVCKPKWMLKYIEFSNAAMESVLFNNTVSDSFHSIASNDNSINQKLAMKVFGQVYYEYHPYIFERLPPFFFSIMNSKICQGDIGHLCEPNF